MNEFNVYKPIYLQIVDHVCDKIIAGHLKEDARVPSIREMSAQMKVNPNTVVHGFDHLQSQNIITNKRGIGYFVASNGKQKAIVLRKEAFLQKELPQFFKTALLLEIDLEELKDIYHKHASHPSARNDI